MFIENLLKTKSFMNFDNSNFEMKEMAKFVEKASVISEKLL